MANVNISPQTCRFDEFPVINFSRQPSIAVLALAGLTPSVQESGANTRLGLHVTSDELTIWQDRAVNGPYKTAGDVSSNSPGNWDRVVTMSGNSLSADRFPGYTGGGCVPNSGSISPEGYRYGDALWASAFRYLVQGNTTYRNNVITELVAQAGVAGVDFSNSSMWCVSTGNAANFFGTAAHLTKCIYAWDYILAGDQAHGNGPVASGSQATIEAWFLAGANYFMSCTEASTDLYYVDFHGQNFTKTGAGTTRCNADYLTFWFGDTVHKTMLDNFNNRVTTIVLPYAMVGIQQNNATMKANAKTYVQALLQFGVRSDNAVVDMNRFTNTNPGLGLVYSLTTMGAAVQIADALARDGDTSLYDYTTSNGDCGTAGGSKSILGVLTFLANFVDHTSLRYGTDISGNNGNANYLIDTNDPISGNNTVMDHILAQPNVYYDDSYLQSIYLRTAPGQSGYTVPGYPASPSTGGYYAWGGAWGILPAMMFMFGQMEGQTDPFI